MCSSARPWDPPLRKTGTTTARCIWDLPITIRGWAGICGAITCESRPSSFRIRFSVWRKRLWWPGGVPAYAAMSRLLEGHKSAGVIDWLGHTALGYAYERGNEIILALWDYGDKPRTVSMPVGVTHVTICDWMGNQRQDKGTIRIYPHAPGRYRNRKLPRRLVAGRERYPRRRGGRHGECASTGND